MMISVLPLAFGLNTLRPPVIALPAVSLPVVAVKPCPFAIHARTWSSVISGLLTECAAPLTWLRLVACVAGKLPTLTVPLTGCVVGKLFTPIFPLPSIASLLAGVVGSAMLTTEPPPPPPPSATLTNRFPELSTWRACPWLVPDFCPPTSVEPSALVNPDMQNAPFLNAAIEATIIDDRATILLPDLVSHRILSEI